MILPHPLYGAFERVNRAEEHFGELTERIALFRQDYLQRATITFDPNPPYKAKVRHPRWENPPALVSILVGEICYNLRSALDYLIFELARYDSGQTQENTQFPIEDTPKKFAMNKAYRLKGISVAHIAAIEQLQPYSGCNWTKVLRTLSNPDKHRMLTPPGASIYLEIDRPILGTLPAVHIHARTKRHAKRPDGVEVEMDLITNLEITIPVSKHEGFPVGWPVEEVVEKLISEVRDTLEAFEPEFK